MTNHDTTALDNIREAERRPRGPVAARPRELAGWTWRIPFDSQYLYVTVNHDGSRVLEVFVANGVLSISVGLLASKMLRAGFSVDEIARSLDRVVGTHSLFFEGRNVTSPEQAVAICLRLARERIAPPTRPS